MTLLYSYYIQSSWRKSHKTQVYADSCIKTYIQICFQNACYNTKTFTTLYENLQLTERHFAEYCALTEKTAQSCNQCHTNKIRKLLMVQRLQSWLVCCSMF